MTDPGRHSLPHLIISISLFAVFASLDVHYTLTGIGGDVSLEGNPAMRHMMVQFGPFKGLVLAKGLVFLAALAVALCAVSGIHREAGWVYYLALTRATREWMRRKKRYWVAFIPLYFVACSQGMAAASWIYLLKKLP